MRFKSNKVGGYQIYAVSGINTVSFGIDAVDTNTDGLLGFAVERRDARKISATSCTASRFSLRSCQIRRVNSR